MNLRLVLPYTQVHSEVIEALSPYSYEASLMKGETDYHYLLAGLWGDGRPFAIVEHDVVIHNEVVPGFESCPEPWCAFPYQYEDTETVALGCSRFSADLLADTPFIFTEIRSMPEYNGHRADHWCVVDGWLTYLLHLHGYKPHIHRPPVTHLNPVRSHNCRPL